MNIAWIVPCQAGYTSLEPYLESLKGFPWVVHIYHGDYPVKVHKRLTHLPLKRYRKMKGLYAAVHLFTDDCAACRAFKPIPLLAQRIFQTGVPPTYSFDDLLFLYLKNL